MKRRKKEDAGREMRNKGTKERKRNKKEGKTDKQIKTPPTK